MLALSPVSPRRAVTSKFTPSVRAALALVVAGLTGCDNAHVELKTDGQPVTLSGAHASLQGDEAHHTLQVCGEFPTVAFRTDTGGSACLAVNLARAQLEALGPSPTLDLTGTASASDTGGTTFTRASSTSPALESAWLSFNCFCAPTTVETFSGTLTLHVVEPRHLAGALNVEVRSDRQVNTVVATFDARR